MTFKERLAGLEGLRGGRPAGCPRRAQSPGGRERKPIPDQGFQELCGQPQTGTQG